MRCFMQVLFFICLIMNQYSNAYAINNELDQTETSSFLFIPQKAICPESIRAGYSPTLIFTIISIASILSKLMVNAQNPITLVENVLSVLSSLIKKDIIFLEEESTELIANILDALKQTISITIETTDQKDTTPASNS